MKRQHRSSMEPTTLEIRVSLAPTCRSRGCRYNVQDYYRDDGCAQRIARSPLFDNLTSLTCVTSIEATKMIHCELLVENSYLALVCSSSGFSLFY